MIRFIVTGGSGFIGSNLIQSLLDKEYEVLNIDVNFPINVVHKKYWKNVDINDFEKLHRIVSDFSPEYIVHLAARTDLNGTDLDDYSANTMGVQNILKVSKTIPSLKKVIITSSMLVCKGGYLPKNQFDYSPNTLYGESKVETEKIVWNNKPNCDWSIIRPTSIWGPWFGTPYKNFFDMIKSKRYFHIGNKSCTKTYGYIGNAIYQIEKILFSETKDENNKVFYIGDYIPTNIEKWANEIATELNYQIFKIPYSFIWLASKFGDFLKIINIDFPITSFRLHNMTTDNIVNLDNTAKIAPNLPYNRINGIRETLTWMDKYKQLMFRTSLKPLTKK